MKLKYRISLIIIGSLLLGSLFLGSSYAIWSMNYSQANPNVISGICFEMHFQELSPSVNLSNAYPISDAKGLRTDPYTFSIENTCDAYGEYYITLDIIDDTTTIDLNKIKVSLDGSRELTPTILNTLETYELEEDNIRTSYILAIDAQLGYSEAKEYNLRIWIDEAAGNEIANKKLEARLTITTIAKETPGFCDYTENKDSLECRTIIASANINSATNLYLNGPIKREDIEKIEFLDNKIVPSYAMFSWDVSAGQNKGVMAWAIDNDSNGKYEVFIGSDNGVLAGTSTSYLFGYLTYLNELNLEYFDTTSTINMSNMFTLCGSNSTSFELDVSSLNTSNVTNMNYMFTSAGKNNPNFTLNLGQNFDTSKVDDMASMFNNTGYNSTIFSLDLSNFNTANVLRMQFMFYYTGYSNPNFKLDVSSFETSKVDDMNSMFSYTGYNSLNFTLNLGQNFDTSNVSSVESMFAYTGYNSQEFTLDLGDKFDVSSVRYMREMFSYTGYSNPNFTLDLGPNFNTSRVEHMERMFQGTGYNATNFTLNLGNYFYTSSVYAMDNMFDSTGYNSSSLILNLGTNFDTSNVESMRQMFSQTGFNASNFNLSLGSKFYTPNVRYMSSMFNYTGYNSPDFTLDLGTNFDTSNVINMSDMFSYTGYSNDNFILDLRNFVFNNVEEYNNLIDINNNAKIYTSNSIAKNFVEQHTYGTTVYDCSITSCP